MVVRLDDTPPSNLALPLARTLARETQAPITLLPVVQPAKFGADPAGHAVLSSVTERVLVDDGTGDLDCARAGAASATSARRTCRSTARPGGAAALGTAGGARQGDRCRAATPGATLVMEMARRRITTRPGMRGPGLFTLP
jgi:hypothetical protein